VLHYFLIDRSAPSMQLRRQG